MRAPSIHGLGIVFGLLCLVARGVEASDPAMPAALVYALEGRGTLALPGQPIRLLHLFDRLPVGAVVEAAPGARLALAFANGRRYEVREGARATVGAGDLKRRRGAIRDLASVPRLPILQPIAEGEWAGWGAGAVRIRAEGITGLYPRSGAAALAEGVVLCFHAVAGARSYRVDIQDERGRSVLRVDTESSPVRVPGGTLSPGRRYHWTVRTLDRAGPTARGEAELLTLSGGIAKRREAAKVLLAAEGAESLVLLAAIDRDLGLWLEARGELVAAAEGSPGDSALRQALTELETRLEIGDGQR